jgi:hypothetical protein
MLARARRRIQLKHFCCGSRLEIISTRDLGGGQGRNRTADTSPKTQKQEVIPSINLQQNCGVLNRAMLLSANDCYPKLAQNRNVFFLMGRRWSKFFARFGGLPGHIFKRSSTILSLRLLTQPLCLNLTWSSLREPAIADTLFGDFFFRRKIAVSIFYCLSRLG